MRPRAGASLEVQLGPLRLRNPVVMASGTFGYGLDLRGIVEPQWVGAVVTKGLSLEPWTGHDPPRLVETPAGLVNAIGLENPGVEAFVQHVLPQLSATGATIIANIVGKQVEEYAQVARRLDGTGAVAAFEINISCPNVKEGGATFATSPVTAARVVAAVRAVTRRPIFVKLAPMGADPVEVARASAAVGADGFTVANTYPALVIDTRSGRPALTAGVGGLSGPAVRPLSVRLASEVYRATGMPIIGSGGVETIRDALEYFLAGARAVAVGTATFHRPTAALEIVEGLRDHLETAGAASFEAWLDSVVLRVERLPAPDEQALRFLQQTGAVLEGHFQLSSGLHSDRYVEKFRLLERPGVAEAMVRLLALRLLDLPAEVVVGPATGGILLAYELARQLGVSRAFFTERVGGRMQVRRGFSLPPGARVLLVEDVVTTGGSVMETAEAVEEAGGQVVGIGCLIDRSGGRFAPPVPFRPLVRLELRTYPPEACPLCEQGIALSDPGSRRIR
ncbi:MAG: dihydroorotate dehydrogenase [Limnochordaceae bacterium]|nr:dihydroorotate dehydrogenase [Limnochordaceae bacterium]